MGEGEKAKPDHESAVVLAFLVLAPFVVLATGTFAWWAWAWLAAGIIVALVLIGTGNLFSDKGNRQALPFDEAVEYDREQRRKQGLP